MTKGLCNIQKYLNRTILQSYQYPDDVAKNKMSRKETDGDKE